MNIGRRVAAARALHRQTQEQLAAELERITGEPWTRNDVAGIENGRRSLKAGELPAFATAQHQNFGWYLSDTAASLPDSDGPGQPNRSVFAGRYLNPLSSFLSSPAPVAALA